MYLSDPVEVVGVDPLNTKEAKELLSGLAWDKQVILEQLDSLSRKGWLQVVVHSHDEASRDEALAFLSARTFDGDANDLRAARGLQGADSAPKAPETADIGLSSGIESSTGTTDAQKPKSTLQTSYSAERDDPVAATPEGDVEAAETVVTADRRLHPSWACAGCPDCIAEAPPST